MTEPLPVSFKAQDFESYQGSFALFLEFLEFLPKRADATEAIARLKQLCKSMRKRCSDGERKQKWRAWVSLVYALFLGNITFIVVHCINFSV